MNSRRYESFSERSHHISGKRMYNFSKTPKPRFEIAFWTRSGSGGVNFMALFWRQPSGMVQITEST